MATELKISRTALNNLMKKLPGPVQEHCKRTKLIASFILEKIKTENWFLDLNLNVTHMIDAVSYHDIGKLEIPKDTLYIEHCRTVEKKKHYKSHPERGIALLEQTFDVDFENYTKKNFERYLYCAIVQHHESVGGDGFPSALSDEEITFTGKLTAIADAFDHLVFVGKVGEPDMDAAMDALRERAGVTLDRQLVDILLSDRERLKKSISFILNRDKNRRRGDAYGLKLFYHPVYDIRDNRLSGYRTEIRINDPFYGMMKPSSFLGVAEQSGQNLRLEKVAFEKLCLEIDKLFYTEREKPTFEFHFSAHHFEKKFFLRFIKSTVEKYEVDPRQIVLSVKDAEMTDLELNWAEIVQTFKKEGFLFMVDEFGDSSSLLTRYEDLPLDRICMKGEYTPRLSDSPRTYSVISGLVQIAYSLHIRVMFSHTERRSDEAELLRMGVRYATGGLYGEPMEWKALRGGEESAPDEDGGDGS